MDMVVDDSKVIQALADQMLTRIDSIVAERIKVLEAHDDVMTAKDMYTKVFHCSSKRFDEIRKMPGFPTNPSPGGKSTFSRKAVEKWLADNQVYS